MTGYAVTFNKRHKRSGHLFQNRYKSVVCEEEPYLLELIRYIHLNPLRAGLVKDLKELDKYPWTGHSSILGKRKNPLIPNQPDKPNKPNKPEKSLAEKTIEDILLLFGDTLKVARRRYRQFVKNGIEQGTRSELEGGGLVRSAGGEKAGLLGRKIEKRQLADERILGSGDFVAKVLEEANEFVERRTRYNISLAELIQRVCRRFKTEPRDLISPSRRRQLSKARAVVSYLAVHELGYSGVQVGRELRISGKGVSMCVERGRKVLDNQEVIGEYLV